MKLDYKARIFTSISIVVVAVWLSFVGGEVLPQWANTMVYYFLIAAAVYMLSSSKKEQNTLRITKLTKDGQEAEFEIDGKIYTEEETIQWIVKKMDVEETEAKRFLKNITTRDENEKD